jgi:beta-lactamase regulating signal transducer with metallopeptidase domain
MNMVDFAIKWAIAGVVAEMVTRRVTPANAATAHRIWLLVLLAPAWWSVGGWLVDPVLFAQVSRDVLPAAVVSPGAGAMTFLAAGYAVVAVTLLGRVGAGLWAVRQMTRASAPITASDAGRLRPLVGNVVTRIRTGGVEAPVTAGLFAPVMLLPAGWREIPPESLAAILHHEAAHVRRRDCAVAIVGAVIEALFWFHPAAWLAGARVRWFAEMACDAEAGRAMDGRRYAAALLSLAARWSENRRRRRLLTAGAETNVARRIHLLLDEVEHRKTRSAGLVLAALLLLAAVSLSAFIDAGRVSDAVPFNSHSAHTHGH